MNGELECEIDTNVSDTVSKVKSTPGPWVAEYGEKHRFHWVRDFPPGVAAPQRVRIYQRAGHFVLQWWDPQVKRNLSNRVDGDLVAAIARARQIDERLTHFRSSGRGGHRRLSHEELVSLYLMDLKQRANAGDMKPATVARYTAALNHYLDFCRQPPIRKTHAHVAGVNRDFRMAFAAFLTNRYVTGKGKANAASRPMKSQAFVIDTVRAAYEWASDRDRGNLLPDGFRNPFRRDSGSRPAHQGDPLADPDITVGMAIDFLKACDQYQLRLFVPMILFGLRAAEPCMLFREHLDAEWLRVLCLPELAYRTKGKRDKRLPLVEELRSFWDLLRAGADHGLLYERRTVDDGREHVPLRGTSLADLIAEFRNRCARHKSLDAAGRKRLRVELIRKAGGLNYDHIEQEFRGLATQLRWPPAATLKDFRHLFATTLGNTWMPEPYKRYLLGQSPGKAAILAYTHLNQLRQQFGCAINLEWPSLLQIINQRVHHITKGL
ncbi:MAG: hypothetical protein FJ271_24710 [Planctomycetes bacterium]|nr:hypothetical protein [Planctomycetota bacterium]